MTRHALNWALALALATLLATSHLIDGPGFIQEQMDIAQSKIEAQEQAQAVHDQVHALHQACGPNAFWKPLTTVDFQCFNKHGRKTVKVSL
jgi:hypothetical protein